MPIGFDEIEAAVGALACRVEFAKKLEEALDRLQGDDELGRLELWTAGSMFSVVGPTMGIVIHALRGFVETERGAASLMLGQAAVALGIDEGEAAGEGVTG